jgi:hypothetical protein
MQLISKTNIAADQGACGSKKNLDFGIIEIDIVAELC